MSKKKITFKNATDLRNTDAEIKKEMDTALDNWVNDTHNTKEQKSLARLNVNIPSDLHKRIKTHCAQNGLKVTELILDLLRKEFSEK